MKQDPLDNISSTPVSDTQPYWSEFLAWAEASGETYATLREIRKVPARLGMIDEDAGLIPADLAYFERRIAPSSFAAVSKSKDREAARNRSNSRVRSALKRFHEVRDPSRRVEGREDWDTLVSHIAENATPPGKGGTWNISSIRALETLRARSPLPPQRLVQAVVDRMVKEAATEKRRSIVAGIRFMNDLVAARDAHPDIAHLLPETAFVIPAGSSRAAPIAWGSLPAAFRDSCETAFRRAIANPADMVADARARIAAGEDPLRVHRELEKRNRKRGKGPGNDEVAREQYLRAVTWLVRASEARGIPRVTLGAITDVMTFDIIDAAAQDQIARSRSADDLKDPETSQTLHNRLLPLRIIARHGLRSKKLVKAIKLVQKLHKPCIVKPGRDGLVKEIDDYCRLLQLSPSMATALVNAPATIARKAEADLETARAAGHAGRELSALRLYAAAVMFVIQLSRPMRTSNLIRVRHRSCETAKGNLTWIEKGKHAELRFAPGEIKNTKTVTVHIVDEDAAVLWRWMTELRDRYLALRGIDDTVYIFPGEAKPRLTKRGVNLPRGCLAPSSADAIWDEGADTIGVRLTPHMARHSVATLLLAIEPGNYAKCASILGDTEETVRKHYGRDSGAAAAREVRKALLDQHPDIFKTLQRRHET